MKVLADMHHGDLFYSLYMLFVERFGWELYYPHGLEWFYKGYWKYHPSENTAHQFLLPGTLPYPVKGDSLDSPQKTFPVLPMTLEEFSDVGVDIVVASVNAHDVSFRNVINERCKRAKLVRQCGNVFDSPNYSVVKNILNSCKHLVIPDNINSVYYHQEFDLDRFCWTTPRNHTTIRNMLHYIKTTPDYPLWNKYKSVLCEMDWKQHGCDGDDGVVPTFKELLEFTKDMGFLWHTKSGGDGYGYNIHYTASCGRPIITRTSHYIGKTAMDLLKDGTTCIDLDVRNFDDNIIMIRKFSQEEEHLTMCNNMYHTFKNTVNFDNEFEHIKLFFERLI